MDTKSTSTATSMKYAVRQVDTVFFFNFYPSKKKEAFFQIEYDLFKTFFLFQLERNRLYRIPQSSVESEFAKITTLSFLQDDMVELS